MVNPNTMAAIPPIANQTYPLNVQIRLHQNGSHYSADIIAEGQFNRVPINLSSHDIFSLNKQLQEAIQLVANNNVDRIDPSNEEINEELYQLATVGHYAFKQIFSNPTAKILIDNLLNSSQSLTFQITSEDFSLPWELLYPLNLTDHPLSYHHFWGFNHIISRIIAQDTRPGDFVSARIPITSKPQLGLMVYDGLPNVAKKEIPFFEALHKTGKINLLQLRTLNANKRIEELKEFKSFCNNPFHLAHFACHAIYIDGKTNNSHILLSDEFPISLQDLVVHDIDMKGNPLIIMNACQTGNLNPLYTSYFAAEFLKHGARGVVATECEVPDAFAAEFSEQLYTHLLNGIPLGQSLLQTRRYFLNKDNPSGLLYSMYASPSIQLVKQEKI